MKKNKEEEMEWEDPGSAAVAVALFEEVRSIVEQAKSVEIKDGLSYVAAAEFVKTIKGLREKVDSAHDPVISHWHSKHKEALTDKKKDEQPLIEAEVILKKKILAYQAEEERKRREEEERIRKENEERIRKQAEEENLKRAQELAERGDLEGAAEAIDAKVEIPVIPVKVESTLPKVEGISSRKLFKAEVVNLKLLIEAIAAGHVPIEAVEANMTFLNAQARAFKKEGTLYAGVRIVSEGSLASGK